MNKLFFHRKFEHGEFKLSTDKCESVCVLELRDALKICELINVFFPPCDCT